MKRKKSRREFAGADHGRKDNLAPVVDPPGGDGDFLDSRGHDATNGAVEHSEMQKVTCLGAEGEKALVELSRRPSQ